MTVNIIKDYVLLEHTECCGRCKHRAWLYRDHKYSLCCTRIPVSPFVRPNGYCPNFKPNYCGTCRSMSHDGGYWFCEGNCEEAMVSTDKIACKKWRKK